MLHAFWGTLIFFGCAFLVFDNRIKDGLIGRHLLTFAAISAAGYAYSGEDRALLTCYLLLLIFGLLLACRKLDRTEDA